MESGFDSLHPSHPANTPSQVIWFELLRNDVFVRIALSDGFGDGVSLEKLEVLVDEAQTAQAGVRKEWQLRLGSLKAKRERLSDAYLDGVLERDEYTKRKEMLLSEEQELEAKLEGASLEESPRERARRILELAGSPKESHERQNQERGRALLQILTSNRSVAGNEVALELDLPFSLLINEGEQAVCGPRLSKPRSSQSLPGLDAVAKKLYRWLLENPRRFTKDDPKWLRGQS